MEFDAKDRERLQESYRLLEHALAILKSEDLDAYTSLLKPYLADPADPSLPDLWREMAKRSESAQFEIECHDWAVERLADLLKDEDLHVVWTKRRATRKEVLVEKLNDELYALYRRIRDKEGKSKTRAVKEAAELMDYTERRAWQIVALREPKN